MAKVGQIDNLSYSGGDYKGKDTNLQGNGIKYASFSLYISSELR
jgi:hypothetical protein